MNTKSTRAILAATQRAEPHPPSRHCGCPDCAPSFEPTPSGAEPVAQSGVEGLRSALNAMLTQFGMDEDEWSKPTFDQARAALNAAPPAAVAGFTVKVDPTLAPDEMSLVQPDLAAKADRAGWVYRSDMALLESGHKVFMYPTSSEPAARAKALPLYTRPAAPLSEGRHAANWNRLTEERLDAFLEDYEMVGESEDGRDACYTPTDGERHLIKDAVMGFLADVDSDGWAVRSSPSPQPTDEATDAGLSCPLCPDAPRMLEQMCCPSCAGTVVTMQQYARNFAARLATPPDNAAGRS